MAKHKGRAGAARERQVRKLYRDEGWQAFKSSDSSVADVIALKAEYVPRLLEVKGNSGSPWMNFRGPEREALRLVGQGAGAEVFLVHWPPRGEMTHYGIEEWPK